MVVVRFLTVQNHRGGLFNAGQLSGVAASTAVGFGAAGNASRGGGWAVRAAQGYTAVGDAVGVYQSTSNLLRNCFTPADLLGFAPVAGYLGGRALRGLGGVDDAARAGNVPVCFVAGTKVLTSEGKKPIEELQVGEWVVASDPELGVIENCLILQQFERESAVVLDIQVGGETITCTPEHPFWVPGQGWVEARALKVGTLLFTKGGQTLSVDSIQRREGLFKVYNIEVERFHTYFVSYLGLLVHNKCNVWGNDVDKVPLWRAALDPELHDINDIGMFRTRHPGYGEVKYFSETAEGAASYAKQAYEAWPQDGPYTMLETAIPRDFITPDMIVHVDGNVPAIVVSEDLLPYMNPPTVLDTMPISGLRQ